MKKLIRESVELINDQGIEAALQRAEDLFREADVV